MVVPLGGWQRYRLSDIRTTGGRRLPSFLALWKLDGRKDGRYLFVLEKLPAVDAKRFQATYKVLETSLSFEAVCLDKLPAGVDAMQFGVDASGQRCYSTYELLRSPHVR